MNSKATSIKAAIADFMVTHGIPGEMKRFLPAKRVAEMSEIGLQLSILAASRDLIKRAVLPVGPK